MHGSVADQSAHIGIWPVRIHGRDRLACSQLRQLNSPGDEKRAGADKKRVGPLTRHTGEGCADLAARVGIMDADL
jgi:hypothetical protein